MLYSKISIRLTIKCIEKYFVTYFLLLENNTFPVFYDFDKSILTGFKVKSVPFNLKIRNSVIEDISEGIMNFDGLNQMFMN